MKSEIRLQNRDIELLIFLGRYKIISLDNTRYIYVTLTYQEKRIVDLVRHNYIRRLKHRYITLVIKGKEYLLENGFEVKLDDDNYIVIMTLINMQTLAKLHGYFDVNKNYKYIHIFGAEENENVVKKYLPKCEYKSLTKEKINELLEEYDYGSG